MNHKPTRGDEVEAWLKRQRDEYTVPGCLAAGAYRALDLALDDYRLHADTGTPLGDEVKTR